MKIKRLYLLGAWLLLGVSASAQITSIQPQPQQILSHCLLYTSDAADEL